jgi:hypothetical protein
VSSSGETRWPRLREQRRHNGIQTRYDVTPTRAAHPTEPATYPGSEPPSV